MLPITTLIEQLWVDYASITPQAMQVQKLLKDRGETKIVNDHIALRTFNDPRVHIDVLARPFIRAGYHAAGDYKFPGKKLLARHFEHDDAALPKVFISELETASFSPQLQRHIAAMLDAVPLDEFGREDLPVAGRLWPMLFSTYEKLAEESEYAAWVAAFGFRANHFTVLVNTLDTFDSLQQLNDFLEAQGLQLNTSGGKIKGSPADGLEQSSTLASRVPVTFDDGQYTIPSCYYEFARRYPDADGNLFTVFITKSADKIFESTDRQQ